MNLFESVKAAVTVRQAAEHYGLEVGRNGMTRCPFHDDRHPSLKLNESYFYCFGCGATGDVIDFVARLFGYAPNSPDEVLDDHFVEACQMLDRIEYLADILAFAELEVRVKTVEMFHRDGTIEKLEERLKRLEKEANTHEEPEIC